MAETTSGRWHPFRDLAGRAHVLFTVHAVADELGGAAYGTDGRRAVVVVSPSMVYEPRRCALAHELVHDEWGVPVGDERAVASQERAVDAEVARRMVPPAELVSWAERRAEVEPVEVWMVCEEFGVTAEVARRALEISAEEGVPTSVPTNDVI